MYKRIPKNYGQGIIKRCPFCGNHAITQNSQGLLVCSRHKNAVLGVMKCICGEPLEIRRGKNGAYFKCIRCGNVNMRQVLQINEIKDVSKPDS